MKCPTDPDVERTFFSAAVAAAVALRGHRLRRRARFRRAPADLVARLAMGKDAAKPARKGGVSDDMTVSDARFSKLHNDPRFMRFPAAQQKVKIDSRFSKMFSDPNFSTSLLRKDLNLFLREANLAGVNADALEGLSALLMRAEGTDLDAGDYSALHELTAAEPPLS